MIQGIKIVPRRVQEPQFNLTMRHYIVLVKVIEYLPNSGGRKGGYCLSIGAL